MNKRNNWGNNRRGGRGRGHGGNSNWNKNQSSNHNRYNKSSTHPEQLSEQEVGITEYISTFDGFTGVIKARFSDFQVNEIDLDGNISKLTDTKIPADFKTAKALDVTPQENPIDQIDQEKWLEILDMMQSNEEKVIKLDVTSLEKDLRTKMHRQIKKVFGEKIVSSTVQEEEQKHIELKRYIKKDGDRRRQEEWPEDKGEYVHFLLYKENMDTMEAVMKIADCLHMKAQNFNYAGVKDRRSKSTQWVSIRKVEPWKLLMKTKCIRSIKIGNLQFKDKPLKLGELKGNRFRIALRNVTAEDEQINQVLESLKEIGFINYYGLQRFGNDKEIPTHDIGIKLLQGHWKEACNLILKPKKSEDPLSDISQAKKVYQETSNAKQACNKINRSNNTCIESKLLNGLATSNVNDYVTALESIPRNMRLLYLHAFQSLIWNNVVSKRIKEFGLKPILGDLVLLDNSETNQPVTEDEVPEIEPAIDNGEGDDKDTNGKMEHRTPQKVMVLTEDDLENYTIYDVVLPTPGFDVIYPEHSIDYYKELLAKYGLELEMIKQRVKTYNLSGNYRKILGKLKDVTWSSLKYNDPNDNLISSDFDELLGHKEPADKPDGTYKSLIVNFNLASSSYATMVLREILKMDTSTKSQSKLNNYHETSKEEQKIEVVKETNSLLTDKDKFEAFKKAIFDSNEKEAPLKRKTDIDQDTDVKKRKLEEEEAGIKTQASLV